MEKLKPSVFFREENPIMTSIAQMENYSLKSDDHDLLLAYVRMALIKWVEL